MSKNRQNVNNHIRFFPLHHFFITPLSLFFFVYTVIEFVSGGDDLLSRIATLALGLVVLTVPLVARIYGTKNQDRIIRLEMRQRYHELTGKSFEEKERQLSKGQIIALRFASNEELIQLVDQAINEGLTAKSIKHKIRNWKADHWRV